MNHQSLAVLVGATVISVVAALIHPDAPPVTSGAAFGLPVALAMTAASASWPDEPLPSPMALFVPDARAHLASADAWPPGAAAEAFWERGHR